MTSDQALLMVVVTERFHPTVVPVDPIKLSHAKIKDFKMRNVLSIPLRRHRDLPQLNE